MELLSKEYGWTPNEIRDMHSDDVDNYLSIITAKREIRADHEKKEQRKAEQQAASARAKSNNSARRPRTIRSRR